MFVLVVRLSHFVSYYYIQVSSEMPAFFKKEFYNCKCFAILFMWDSEFGKINQSLSVGFIV